MSIISIRDNENNRWKRNSKNKQTNKQIKNKNRKEQGGYKL